MIDRDEEGGWSGFKVCRLPHVRDGEVGWMEESVKWDWTDLGEWRGLLHGRRAGEICSGRVVVVSWYVISLPIFYVFSNF